MEGVAAGQHRDPLPAAELVLADGALLLAPLPLGRAPLRLQRSTRCHVTESTAVDVVTALRIITVERYKACCLPEAER